MNQVSTLGRLHTRRAKSPRARPKRTIFLAFACPQNVNDPENCEDSTRRSNPIQGGDILIPTIEEMKLAGDDVLADAAKLFKRVNVGLPADKQLLLR